MSAQPFVTNVPPVEFTSTGIVVPQESDIYTGVMADFNAAFNGNLNTAANTPQGQLASSQTAAIAAAYAAFAQILNGIDPDTAVSFMQDAIGRIYFMNRTPGLPTVVQCTLTGAAFTPINAGAQAQDTSGNLYVCLQAGQIGVGGNVVLPFANIVNGPIPCPANTLTVIFQAIPGWESITNAAAGVLGADVETPTAFEFRRQQSVALNAHGSPDAIFGAVFEVPGVIDAYVIDNVKDSTVNVGSTAFALLPHSVYVGVAGGAAQAIADAIWSKKDLGCNMNGNTVETVVDSANYQQPFPEYPVTFQTLTNTAFFIVVNLQDSDNLPDNIESLVQAAVLAQFTGLNGGARARAGALLLASFFYGPVQAIGNEVSVLSIGIGQNFTGDATLANASHVITITTATSGALSPGTVLTGTDIPTGAYIVQQLTGTIGGTGTYYMSQPASGTVGAPEAVTGAPGVSVLVGIDQEPTIQASNVIVNLVS